MYWAQPFWRDGVRYGDMLAEAWDIYTGGDIWMRRMTGGFFDYPTQALNN